MRRITFQRPQKHPIWSYYIVLMYAGALGVNDFRGLCVTLVSILKQNGDKRTDFVGTRPGSRWE